MCLFCCLFVLFLFCLLSCDYISPHQLLNIIIISNTSLYLRSQLYHSPSLPRRIPFSGWINIQSSVYFAAIFFAFLLRHNCDISFVPSIQASCKLTLSDESQWSPKKTKQDKTTCQVYIWITPNVFQDSRRTNKMCLKSEIVCFLVNCWFCCFHFIYYVYSIA